ncbi:MAG: patatin-like phospholipase family protein [Brevefilum sp.]|nr:patatin-like phospholipase family protein [Brevefilum sp.]MDT8381208.1 patatin-like phospholipase family protein [Brevefilum sp.]MDW7754405.1 patatin-like phospholipase family protein [Brevefilum sp.]
MEITLALGGGGVRGIAHIGVLRALENHGFKIKAIAGTSAGGLVGAVYAAGFSTEKIEKTVNEMDANRSFWHQSNDQPSLLGLSGITKILSELLADRTFEELKIPFAATAVSLYSGEEIILTKGKVIDAVLATIAVPGVFPSQEIGGRILIDGGVLDPVPVQVARWMCPDLPVVAVMLHKTPEGWVPDELPLPISIPGPSSIVERLTKLRPVQALKIFTRSIEVSSKHLSELSMQVHKPEVIITPRVGHIGLLQTVDAEEMIREGMNATEEVLKQIESEANWMKKLQRKVKGKFIPGEKPEIWGAFD